MPTLKAPSWIGSAVRTLRWGFYIAIAAIGLVFLYYPLWPHGGPDTKQARDIAMLLSSVLGILGICTVVIYLTAPQFQ